MNGRSYLMSPFRSPILLPLEAALSQKAVVVKDVSQQKHLLHTAPDDNYGSHTLPWTLEVIFEMASLL